MPQLAIADQWRLAADYELRDTLLDQRVHASSWSAVELSQEEHNLPISLPDMLQSKPWILRGTTFPGAFVALQLVISTFIFSGGDRPKR